MLDMDTIGFFLYMEQKEQKEQEQRKLRPPHPMEDINHDNERETEREIEDLR